MDEKTFYRTLAGHFCTDAREVAVLADDFRWIVECAISNAVYGRGSKAPLAMNTTAKQLLDWKGDEILDAVLGCERVGYAICAEDRGRMEKYMFQTLDHYEIPYKV